MVTLGGTVASWLEYFVPMLFWHLLPGPIIGGQAFRVPPLTAAARSKKKTLFDEKTGSL